jgi:UDP-glucose 4-epimerase
MFRGKRIAVTGGAGFIGSHVVERLAGRNEVVVLDNLAVGRLQNLAGAKDRVEVVKGSILDPKAVKRALGDADAVLHLAALTSVPESLERPLAYAEANVMGTLNVLTAAQETGARRVVLASTCAVYGRATGPLREESPPDPLSPYAVTKLACEFFCRSAAASGGVEAVALRLFNVYGPRQSADSPYASVVAKFCEAATTGTPATLFGDGSQTRDFVYVGDVAEAFELAGTAKGVAGEVINVGSGQETSIADLVRVVGEIRGKPLEIVRKPTREGEVMRSRADPWKARSLLGFQAKVSLREGLRRTLDAWAREG